MGWNLQVKALTTAALVAAAVAGCAKSAPTGFGAAPAATSFRTASVPSTFLWGVSTAGYQWEGGDTASQWAAWDKLGKTEERNVKGANGYELFALDAGLSRGMGCNAFRTSLEWSRIEPEEGRIDPAAVAHYHAMLDAFKAQGQTPIITLMHFSIPEWVARDGGWENPKTAERFAKFAAFVGQEYGRDVDWYLTFNEPNVYLLGGYVAGMMPPGKKNPLAGVQAMRHMMRAHGLAYDALHAHDATAKVGFNMYTADFALGAESPAPDQSPEDEAAQRLASDTEFSDGAIGSDRAHPKLDFAAFDYYCRFPVKLPFVFPRPDTWQVAPEGFYKAIKRYHKRYRLPVLIAENGMATWNGEPRADGWTRGAYTVAHVKQMQRAIAEGVPVLGYVQWSITDNYEWGTFGPRFGLYAVDCRNGDFTRKPTDGVEAYRQIIAGGGVDEALEARFPAPGARLAKK